MIPPQLMSWGRYPDCPQIFHASGWRNDLPLEISALAEKNGSTLAFGNGRSYGDSCLASSNAVLYMRPLNRFISVDWQNGVLQAEAGVTLEEILDIAIPRGWFLPVTPGTKYVTLGGAVANDVHGKNHHVRGTFGRHVRRFCLVRSDQVPLICSETENSALYAATIGGLGLTGVIEWVELQLMPITSSQLDVMTIRFDSLRDFFLLSDELDHGHEYTVAWVDCLAKGAHAGRGVFMVGNHASQGSLQVNKARKLNVPMVPPVSFINRLTLPVLNSAYYRLHKTGRHHGTTNYESFFYPLDGIKNWNRLYGPKGFQQYQCVIPDVNAEAGIRELLNAIAETGKGSFLAVIKKCGAVTSPGWLSFPLPGVSLALDFAQSDALNASLFPRLDAIVRETGGRLYPAKDAHMSGEDFRSFYPKWEQIESLRDPALCSRFWKRVTEK